MQTDEAAVDRRLAERPGEFEALIAKADLRAAAGDERAAVSFYQAALRAARAVGGALPFSWKALVERAQAAVAGAHVRFEQHLERHLTASSLPPGHRPPRFQHSLDLLTGRRQAHLQLQQPASYYYPELPQRRFYERAELPWADEVEAMAPAILNELHGWLDRSEGETFRPYLVSDASRPRNEYHGLVDNPAWSTLYIWEKGAEVAEVASHFPRTLETVRSLPLPHIGVRAPSVLFSRLGSGARIPPHHGMLNARLICHLPLIVPEGCGFRVGGESRRWEVGKLLVFDDSVEHEAWNESGEDRIILIFDVWRPELDSAERRAVTALFEAIDTYGA